MRTSWVVRKRSVYRDRRRGPGLMSWVWKLTVGILLVIFVTVGSVAASIAGVTAGVYTYYAKQLPDPSAIEHRQEKFETTKIYDRTGKHLLYEVIDPTRGDRTYVPLSQIPKQCREATIALEDRSFYQNPGINPRGIMRAFVSNLQGKAIQGGSSITQQLIKNVLIPPEERYKRSYARKIKEMILALEITRRYPKDKILEWYLNSNYYGNFAYGLQAAAKTYFDKNVQDLDLAECAMLAALPQYPARNPIDAPKAAKRRQKKVLDSMVEAGYITKAQAEAAYEEKLKIRKSVLERFHIQAPHFSLYVRQLLEDRFGPNLVYGGGLKVYTTLDWDLQHAAQCIARLRIANLRHEEPDEKTRKDCAQFLNIKFPSGKKKDEDHNVSNAAVVAIRPKTGEILAMVGSLDYYDKDIDGEVNVALASRQPGSSFKPFTYMTAFATRKYTPASMVLDVRTAFPDPPNPPYVPENYDRKYHGPQSFRQALQRSYNIPAVWVMSKVGVGNVIRTAHKMGINTLNKDLNFYGLSLTLGGGEVRLLDMTYAFSVWANNGVMAGRPVDHQRAGFRQLDPVAILLVKDRNGKILWEYKRPETKRVVSAQIAYLMNNVLSDTRARLAAFGRFSKYLALPDRPAAAKTGTTNDYRDAWTIGYTPDLAVGVWVGNSDNTPMVHVPGSLGAAPIWHYVMEWYHKGKPVHKFVEPPGIVHETVCWPSGLKITPECQKTEKEVFIAGTEPKQPDNIWQAFEINKVNGKLATPYTPPEYREKKIYMILPPEAADWIRENHIPQPPKEYDDMFGPGPVDPFVGIAQPKPYSYVHGIVNIVGNARQDSFRFYRVDIGQGMQPTSWQTLTGEQYHQVENNVLATWDTTNLNGPYTIRLSLMRGDGGVRETTVPVIVDNRPPEVKITHPNQDDVYVMEEDEQVNVQADAKDDWAMDHVDFYIDGHKFAESTVPPYNQRWRITMSDTVPVPNTIITKTKLITQPDGSVAPVEYTYSKVTKDELGRLVETFYNGMTIISDTNGYTETHVITVTAVDKAGNSTTSDPVRIRVKHKEKKKEKSTGSLTPGPVASNRAGRKDGIGKSLGEVVADLPGGPRRRSDGDHASEPWAGAWRGT